MYNACCSIHPVATAYLVTVGMQHTRYTVEEVDEYQLVCFEVLFGNVDDRELLIYYTTQDGTASEYSHHQCSFFVSLRHFIDTHDTCIL